MFLLDTNILIWALENNRDKLNNKIYEIITNPNNLIFVSIISYWEIVIKVNLGKLIVPDDLPQQIKNAGFEWLNMDVNHITTLKTLPDIHKDPFDRLMIAQCIANNLTFITANQIIAQYPLKYLGLGQS